MATSHVPGTDLCPVHEHFRFVFSHGCVLDTPHQSTSWLVGATVRQSEGLLQRLCLLCAGRQGEEEGCSSSSQGEARAGS